jgi:hypothetical protein
MVGEVGSFWEVHDVNSASYFAQKPGPVIGHDIACGVGIRHKSNVAASHEFHGFGVKRLASSA